MAREESAGRTHFFPPDHDESTRRQLAVLRRETARDVVLALADDGPASPARVAEAVGIARSTLSWHVERLDAEGLIEKRTDDRGRVTLFLADPELVGARLAAVEPAGPERLVDRFTRLVAGLVCPPLLAGGDAVAAVAFCASFAGMAAPARIPSPGAMLLAGGTAGLAFVGATPYFVGFGGKLGTIAFAACLATAGVLSLGRLLAPTGSDAVTG